MADNMSIFVSQHTQLRTGGYFLLQQSLTALHIGKSTNIKRTHVSLV